MILVTGSVRARTETFDEALAHSLAHVARSRTEPGCISHHVHRDAEDTLRLVFVERWDGMDALKTHFRVPESRAFGKALAALAAEPPDMQLYEATLLPMG